MAKMQNGNSSTMLQVPEHVPETRAHENGNPLRRNQPRSAKTSTPTHRSMFPVFSPLPETIHRDSLPEMTFEDAKSALLSATGGLLVPTTTESTWHSIPLAFAMLPAIAGTLFTGGEGLVTDVLLLTLVAVFLNWFVKFPWEWYQKSRQGRLDLESIQVASETQEERVLEGAGSSNSNEHRRRMEALEELRKDEFQALVSCFLGPLAGAYLMYCTRLHLSRPSGGLISNFNLSVFLLAAELRPFAEVVRLLRDRNEDLRQVARQPPPSKVELLEAKVDSLQAEVRELAVLTTKAIERDADVDALNRAVRRYEKKEALHCIQTEDRLVEMDGRLNDVLTLAAAATAQQSQQNFSILLFEWVCTVLVVPFSVTWKVINFPKELITRVSALSGGLAVGLVGSQPRVLLKHGNNTNGKRKEKSRSTFRGVVKGKGY